MDNNEGESESVEKRGKSLRQSALPLLSSPSKRSRQQQQSHEQEGRNSNEQSPVRLFSRKPTIKINHEDVTSVRRVRVFRSPKPLS
jgi:hypothetical protein